MIIRSTSWQYVLRPTAFRTTLSHPNTRTITFLKPTRMKLDVGPSTSEDNPILRRLAADKAAASQALARHRAGRPLPSDPSIAELDKKMAEKPPTPGTISADSLINSRLMVQDRTEAGKTSALGQAIPPVRLLALDPKPLQRRRWERSMVIREIRRRGRLSNAEIIKRTERALTARSPLIRTSMKKLNPLAIQIAGKSVEDAITQMRFSKKKAAISVKKQLEVARDQAIVERGMGMGMVDKRKKGTKAVIRLKDGNMHKVEDRTALYVEQAWTNKGSYGRDLSKRARGRIDLLRLPQTSISVIIKEEATLIREANDRKAREAKKKIWTSLPDRPITGQRQYYCW